MAGSFDVFRKYQRALLAAVAILAMLAFFVLPPFLQMAPSTGGVDPLVATWSGGGIREAELEWAVAMRRVLNDFLAESVRQSGGNPAAIQRLGETEADVVRTLVLAREAEANGIVIGNAAVNQFLGQLTRNMVRPEQFESLIAGRRLGQTPVTAADVFDSLRTVLAADRMQQLSFAGFAGDPPGVRWDIFRQLEQEATVEVVPVVVESLAGEVAAPQDRQLREFFDRFKDALPVDRSPDPGFREPHRISYAWVNADREALEAAAAPNVTDAEIEKFYEDNKVRLYRVKTPPESAGTQPAKEKPAAEKQADEKPAADKPAGDKPADVPATDGKPAAEQPGPAAAQPQDPGGADAAAPEGDKQSAARSRGPFVPAKFRQPSSTDQPADADKPTESAPGDGGPAADRATDGEAAAKQPASEGVEPLDKVRDDVRKRLAAEAVSRRLDSVFQAITADVAGFSRDYSRWKAESGSDATKPAPPDIAAIAERQGLQGGQADQRTVGEAVRAGGVGASFQLSLDPQSPMGFRQAQWADLFFGMQRPLWRPVETRDVPGNRYLSWKTADAPAFVPEFDAVRADVERAWRVVEARPLARKIAEEIAAAARGGRTLAEAVVGRPGPKVEPVVVGPFTWLPRDAEAAGAPAAVSQPEGLSMPGEEFMQAVFGLEPGGTAVAFNEPRTVCYAIRLASFAPPEDDLRKKFIAATADQRRLGAVAEREQVRAFRDWVTDVEKRAGLEWKRPPR